MLDLGGAPGDDRGGREPGGGLGADRGGARAGGSGGGAGSTGGGCSTRGGGSADRGSASGRRGACAGGSGTSGARTGGAGAGGTCAGRARARGTPSGAGGTAATAEEAGELADQQSLQEEQRTDGEEGGQRLAVGAKLGAELAAGLAALDVAAHRAADLGEPLGGLGELEADLVAGELAGLARLGEGDPGPDQKRLHPGDGGVHRLGDLLVAHRVDLAEEQRRALGLREPADVAEQVAELLAVLDPLEGGDAVHVGVGVHRVLAVGGRLAKVVEAAVAGDPVEPGADGDRPLVGDHRVVGGDEDLLEDVLGVLGAAEHLAAEAEQPRLVALDQRLEGVLVPSTSEGDEVLVALELEERGPPGKEPALLSVCECGGFHGVAGRGSPLPRRTR